MKEQTFRVVKLTPNECVALNLWYVGGEGRSESHIESIFDSIFGPSARVSTVVGEYFVPIEVADDVIEFLQRRVFGFTEKPEDDKEPYETTYSSDVRCRNCDHYASSVKIPRGTLVGMHPCPQCACYGLKKA